MILTGLVDLPHCSHIYAAVESRIHDSVRTLLISHSRASQGQSWWTISFWDWMAHIEQSAGDTVFLRNELCSVVCYFWWCRATMCELMPSKPPEMHNRRFQPSSEPLKTFELSRKFRCDNLVCLQSLYFFFWHKSWKAAFFPLVSLLMFGVLMVSYPIRWSADVCLLWKVLGLLFLFGGSAANLLNL